MIPKYKQRSYILDVMHRGVVNVCITVSAVTMGLIVYQTYYYYKYVKPGTQEAKINAVNKLLVEGQYEPLLDKIEK